MYIDSEVISNLMKRMKDFKKKKKPFICRSKQKMFKMVKETVVEFPQLCEIFSDILISEYLRILPTTIHL